MLIGRGILNWKRFERITDRYGSIHLSREPFDLTPTESTEKYLTFPRDLAGERGTLYAIVVATRTSTHVGDIARGFAPETPRVGEKIVLGFGTVFFEHICMGLKPDDDREHDWLDPRSLYRAHEQTVDLYFEPATDEECGRNA